MRLFVSMLCLCAALCAAGCSVTRTQTVTETVTQTETDMIVTPDRPDDSEDADTPPSPAPPAQAGVGRRSVLIYLLRGERLAAARREVRTPAIALESTRQLLAAPSAQDRRYRLGSSIPSGTTVRGVSIRAGTATVDLSRRFASGGGSLSMLTRVAQVVYTLTQFDGVERVAFRLDGRRVTTIGGEGIIVWPPVSRADVEGQAPAILVEQPAPGDAIASPLVVRGTANVFEAVLFVELRDGDSLVARRRVQASAGTGTRGTFETRLDFDPAAVTAPQIVAYSRSPRDGSRVNLVRVPVALANDL